MGMVPGDQLGQDACGSVVAIGYFGVPTGCDFPG